MTSTKELVNILEARVVNEMQYFPITMVEIEVDWGGIRLRSVGIRRCMLSDKPRWDPQWGKEKALLQAKRKIAHEIQRIEGMPDAIQAARQDVVTAQNKVLALIKESIKTVSSECLMVYE